MPFAMPFAMQDIQGLRGRSPSSPEWLSAAGCKAYLDACVAMGIRHDLKILSEILAHGAPMVQVNVLKCQHKVTFRRLNVLGG